MKRCLTILEVSQKQAYIFKSKRLINNIIASDIISYITSGEFFEKNFSDFYTEENMVYAGGGHTILSFLDKNEAIEFSKKVSIYLFKKYPELEVFIKTIDYDEKNTPSKNIEELIKALEIKKSFRFASFKEVNIGIEKEKEDKKKDRDDWCENQDDLETNVLKPYKPVSDLKELGGSKDESNFIAVVHIDGNQMGKRVSEFNKSLDKEVEKITDQNEKFKYYAKRKKDFCVSIDSDFKEAYSDMLKVVKKSLEDGKLDELNLKDDNFPIRKIITAGDDICFVTEGRIGIECAVIFMKKLWEKINKEDDKNYSACAGVAIVHQKYPFYKAYEISEALCSSAKKYVVSKLKENSNTDEKSACAIDWHLEFGDLQGTIEELRKINYYTKKIEGKSEELSSRPYYVCGDLENVGKNTYKEFKIKINEIKRKDISARGKLKELRNYLKEGKVATENYMKRNLMNFTIGLDKYMFDSLELMDSFIDIN